MPNTKLVILGHPKAGMPIMLASPSAAIDLPLKILVAEDSEEPFESLTTAPAIFRVDMAFLRC